MSSHPVRRNLLRSIKGRAIIVAITISSLAFVGTAYWHYKTHAATDYLCMTMNGSLWANPVERYDLPDTRDYNSMYLIDRPFITGATVHISKSYLYDKYPHI